jgi:flagellin
LNSLNGYSIYTANDKTAMQAEFADLSAELTNIMSNTKFGGQGLLTGGTLAAAVKFQIGSDASETFSFDASAKLTAVDTAQTALAAGDLTTGGNAAITLANNMLTAVGDLRSHIGAGANRLDHANNNLANMRTNTENAKGRIMDTDYAQETADMTSKTMMMQASTAMLKQSS